MHIKTVKNCVKYLQILPRSARKMQSGLIPEALQSVSCVLTDAHDSYRRRRLFVIG